MLAISISDFEEHGCPNCGCDTAMAGRISGGGVTTGTCEECKLCFAIMADRMEKSSMGFGTGRKNPDGTDEVEYPVRIPHPRAAIAKHAYQWPDPRPKGGGEYWKSRGIGYDLSGFVESRQAGERLLEMVKSVTGKEKPDSWLDYRPREPKWIQFKFQPSEFDLERLDRLSQENNGVLTTAILKQALATEKAERKGGLTI